MPRTNRRTSILKISTSESLKRGSKNQIDPGEVIGRFLNDHPSGDARVIESSYPIDIEDVEAA